MNAALVDLLTLSVTVTHVAHSGAADAYGNPTESTSSSVYLGELQQIRRDEQTRDANIQGETWLLILEPDAVIDGGDRVTVNSLTYELDGPPWHARDPQTDEYSHWEATVRRTV